MTYNKFFVSDDLIRLESREDTLHKQVAQTLDELIYKTTYLRLEKEFDNDNNEKLLDEAIERELSDFKSFDPLVLKQNDDDDDDDDDAGYLDKLENYLKNLVKIRNDIVDQQIISDAYESNTVDKEMIDENLKLAQSKTESVNELTNNIKKLKEIKDSNLIKIDKVKELIDIQRESKISVNISDIGDGNFDDVKTKYKKLIGKNLMLSHFITDFISALSNTDIVNDDKLLQILMDCGDYSEYDLLYD